MNCRACINEKKSYMTLSELKAPVSCFKSETILESKSILLESNQTCQNQFYTSRTNFDFSKSGTKHTLTVSSSFLFKACISSTIRRTSVKIICSGTLFMAAFLACAFSQEKIIHIRNWLNKIINIRKTSRASRYCQKRKSCIHLHRNKNWMSGLYFPNVNRNFETPSFSLLKRYFFLSPPFFL